MSTQTQLSIRGLARDPNSFAAAGAGALRRAENVVVRAEGVAESRPNFDLLREKTATSKRVRSLHEFDGSVIAIESDEDFLNWTAGSEIGDISAPVAGAFEPAGGYDACESKFASARDNLYVTGLFGSLAIENVSLSARFVGIDMRLVMDPWTGGFITPIGGGLRFAYQLVYVRKDSRGYVRRSPPSERYVLDGRISAGMLITIPAGQLAAGDQVEFYRSFASTTPMSSPRPEHFLAFTYTITSADIIASGFHSVADTTADADLGAQLYTDAEIDGVIASKFRPPAARTLAFWARCMWYGATREAARYALTMKTLGRPGTPVYWDDVGWSFTSGSPTATATRTVGVFVGMYITGESNIGPEQADTYLPANTQVTAIVGSTITLSHSALANGGEAVLGYEFSAPNGLASYNPIGSGTIGTSSITSAIDTKYFRVGMWFFVTTGGVPTRARILSITDSSHFVISVNLAATFAAAGFFVGDVVTINTIDFLYGSGDPTGFGDGSVGAFGVPDMTLGRSRTGVVMDSLALAIQTYAFIHPSFSVNATVIGDRYKDPSHPIAADRDASGMWPWPGTVPTTLELEEGAPTGDSFRTTISVSCTCAAAFSPSLPQDSDSPFHPNRLSFSAVDEPEAVPLANFIDVGLTDSAIQAIVPLRNALLVFKEDGVWRISGSAPSSWTVEQIDTTLRLIRPETVSVMNGTAYAWCDRGFFAVDESGAESLSANLLDAELRAFASFCVGHPLTHGAFVTTWRRRSLVLLGVPFSEADSVPQDVTAKIYAYCLTTNAWSEWPLAWATACASELDTMYEARAADAIVEYEIRKGIAPRGYDREFNLTGATFPTATTITVAVELAGSWEPAIGDFVGRGGETGATAFRRITDVATDGSDYTITIESAFPAGSYTSAYAREAAVLKLEWHPAAPARVPTGVLCREIHTQLDLRDGAGDIPTLPSYVVGGTSERDTTPQTITSAKARTATIQPLRVGASRQIARSANIAPYFETGDVFPIRVQGISLVYEPTSERTTR